MPTAGGSRPLHQAGAFLALTAAVSLAAYLPVVAANRGWVDAPVPGELAAVGVVGPALAALALAARSEGRAGVGALVRRATAWRFGARWWVATLALPPLALGAASLAYLSLLGGTYTESTAVAAIQEAGPAAALLVPLLVVVTLLLALGEELGWRGYLLPRLQARFGALPASLLLGVAWFAWHLPMLALPGDTNGAFPLPLWAASILALSVVYAWLFDNTGGSVLSVTLFHAGFDVWGQLVALHPAETGDARSAVAIAGTYALLAVAVVAAFGPATLTRRPR